MKTDPNEPAFAHAPAFSPECGTMGGAVGLTKREYFAAAALQGLLANRDLSAVVEPSEAFAAWAVEQADDLIKALN